MPLGAKFIYANGVNALSLVFYRNCMALPLMALIMFLRKESFHVTFRQFRQISCLAAAGCAVTPSLLFLSYNYISSGIATTSHFIYPAAVIFGGALFFREKIRPGQVFCVALCTLGVSLFYSSGSGLHPLGSVLALTSGITYAAYILLLANSGLKALSGIKMGFFVALSCSLLMFVICIASGQFTLPANLSCWIACFIFSAALCVGAVLLFQKGTFLIGGQRASILSTFEPITSILVGVLVFGEPFGFRTFLGGTCVIASAILIALLDMRASHAKETV